MPPKITALDAEHIVRRYSEGFGVSRVAQEFGVSPRPVERILREYGIRLRNRSEQQQARMDRATTREIEVLTAAAHDATRGRRQGMSEKVKRAKTLERSQKRMSSLERKVQALVKRCGLDLTPQTAVGPYNCDFTSGAVAVEIWGGGWHWYGKHIASSEKRIRFLLDAGFNVVIACVDVRRRLFGPAEAEQLVAAIEEARADPSPVHQYRMIWSGTEFATVTRADAVDFTFEPPFAGARDPATGQYRTVAR